VRLPGDARPLIREADYLGLVEDSSYADDRVGREREGVEEAAR
jgi:hypothetical protein